MKKLKKSEFDFYRLKILRADLGLTQEAMAKSLNISKRMYRYIEDGEKSPSVKTILELEKVYGEELKVINSRSIETEERRHMEELIKTQRELIDHLIEQVNFLKETYGVKKKGSDKKVKAS